MNILKIQLAEVFCTWIKDPYSISCRISLQNQAQVLNYNEIIEFPIRKPNKEEYVHITILNKNIVIGSQTVSLEWMFGNDLQNQFNDWIKTEIPLEEIKESAKDLTSKTLRIRLTGIILLNNQPDLIPQALETPQIYKSDISQDTPQSDEGSLGRNPGSSPIVVGLTRSPRENFLLTETDLDHRLDNFENLGFRNSENPLKDLEEHKKLLEDIIKDNDSLSLHLNQEKKSQIIKQTLSKPPKPTTKKQNLLKISTTSTCTYINLINGSEDYLNKTKTILLKLESELGRAYHNILAQSTKRDSRILSRSPDQKFRSGSHSPMSSQRSLCKSKPSERLINGASGLNSSYLSSFRVDDENFLELPSRAAVSLERISVNNLFGLSHCILGTLAKKALTTIQTQEYLSTCKAIQEQQKSNEIVESSIQASVHEYSRETDNYNILINKITHENQLITNAIQNIKQKSEILLHDKHKYELELNKLIQEKKSILKIEPQSYLIDEIKQFYEANDRLQQSLIVLEEKINELARDYKNDFSEISEYQYKCIQEKDQILKEIQALALDIETLRKHNTIMESELLSINTLAYIDSEFDKIIKNFISESIQTTQSLDNLITQFIYLRSKKEDYAKETEALIQDIETRIKSYHVFQSSYSKDADKTKDLISDLAKKLKKVKIDTASIEEVYSKKNNIDKSFDLVYMKSNSNQDTKDHIIKAILYFSDFLFNISESILQQNRISSKIKAIILEKDIELEAMRMAVADIKAKNPVYFPIEGDFIDNALSDYLNSRDGVLLIPFIRESYGVYTYGSKRIMISCERNKIIIKLGGGYMPIEKFIDNYTESEIDKQTLSSPKNKRKQGLDPKVLEHQTRPDDYFDPAENKHVQYESPLSPRPQTPIIEEDI